MNKTIQEYFAELSAAGLAPDWSDVIANTGANKANRIWRLEDPNYNISTWIPFNLQWGAKSERIQLRSNGIDLVKLEWQKPIEQDVGKMCWVYDKEYDVIGLMKLRQSDFPFPEDEYCLLATHGRLAPRPEDFGSE